MLQLWIWDFIEITSVIDGIGQYANLDSFHFRLRKRQAQLALQ
jgi:hypothetical protein